MSSSKKAIQINPEYFNLKKNKSIKKETREKKTRNKTGKQQKKELLKRLKDLQDKKKYNTENNNNDDNETDDNNIVNNSINFLNTLANEQQTTNNKTPENITHTEVTTTDFVRPLIHLNKPNSTELPIPLNDNVKEDILITEPPYSNLKGSNKPSYREWLRQKTAKIPITVKNKNDNDNLSLREDKLKKIQKKYNSQKKHRKTIKITETFGKRNGKISIHIKNKHEKNKIEQEIKTLKKHTIPKIKSYLKEHNLLKIGSCAPNDIIRELYEKSILCGNVTNNNNDILVHNFLEN